MKKKVLVYYHIPKEGLQQLAKDYTIIYPDNVHFTEDEVLELIPDCEVLISAFGHKVPNLWIEKAPKLKMISNYGAGVDNIDIAFATQKGIRVTNTPNPVSEPTAELTIGLMLSLLRRITELDTALKSNDNLEWGIMKNLGSSLKNKKVGIIGIGKIGKDVARKLKAFNTSIIYNQRTRLSEQLENELQAEYMPINQLLKESDIISLHTPLHDSTYHLINKDSFDLMKKNTVIINTARGAVINEHDLVDALQNGNIAGAALDVFEFEPKITTDLKTMKNVILVPHIGTATIETRTELAEDAASNIINFFNNTLTKNIINPELEL